MKRLGCQCVFWVVVFIAVFIFPLSRILAKEIIDHSKSFSRIIEDDWARQEKRKNRSMYDPGAIRELWQRTHQLLEDLEQMPGAGDYRKEESQLKPFQEQVTNVESLDISKRLELYHRIFAMDTEGKNLRQLTEGCEDDFDPCPLPDGGLAFMSTRRACFCRCNNPWEPIPSYTLHRMDADGQNIQVLSVHETNEWHPSVLHDGRIVYIRWDYVDRSAANYHGLWVSNTDGTNPSVLFGNYTQRINACYQPKAIPGSNRIAFLAGAHHADVGGSLVIFDPAKEKLDAKSGEDDFQSIEVLTPEVCFPEAPGWPDSYFHSPWPLSENYFLVSFSFDPLPGMGPRVNKDTETGIYYFDRFGNLELLYREKGISSIYPIPLSPRPKPAVIPPVQNPDLGDEGEFILADVNRSMFAMPTDRSLRELRIYQVLPKTHNHIANQPRIGHANAESARMLLGSVPVEKDGSAYFRAPAWKPIYFQAVDAFGKAVQTMRSVTYLQPGERRSCVGCHETRGNVPFYGTYSQEENVAQRNGKIIPPPKLQ